MAKSTIYLRRKLAESFLNGLNFKVDNLYVGLFKVMPTLEDASDGVEHDLTLVDSGYRRINVKNNWTEDTTVNPLVRYKLTNSISFESKSVGWENNNSSSNVTGVGFWDADVSGNCLIYADINPVRIIYPNQDMEIDASGLTIDLTTI